MTVRTKGPLGRLAVFLLAVSGAFGAPPSAGAQQSVSDLFRESSDRLAAGDAAGALAGYHRIAALGFESPNLLYDMAVAYLRVERPGRPGQVGQPGRAILMLERLLVLDPGDAGARALLDDVRAELGRERRRSQGTAGLFPRRRFLHAAAARVSETTIAVWTVALSFLTFGLLWVRRFTRSEAIRLGLGIAAPVAAVGLAAAAVLLFAKIVLQPGAAEGVVVRPDGASVHEAPSSGSRESFRLPEGDMVRVRSRSNGWLEIRDEADREGWVEPGAVGEIFGPLPIPQDPGRK
jgi:hypothetical protein